MLPVDRVQQTTLAGGLGSLVLGTTRVEAYLLVSEAGYGAASFDYCIEDRQSDLFEVGRGAYDADNDTLLRNVLLASTTGDWIDFPVGTEKRVFACVSADSVKQLHKHYTDPFTLSNGDIALGYVTLTHRPLAGSTQLVIEGAPTQIIGQAYSVDLDTKRVQWSGLTLDGLLSAGERLIVNYATGIVWQS